jgi:hypothetical protein
MIAFGYSSFVVLSASDYPYINPQQDQKIILMVAFLSMFMMVFMLPAAFTTVFQLT